MEPERCNVAMVGWHSMDSGSTGESWIDGLDWTPVEVGNRASLKVRQSSFR